MTVEGVYQLDIYNFYDTNLNAIDQITISHKVVNKHWTVLICTRQVEKRVEDVEALRISSLNELVGVHFSDLRSVDTP